MNMSQFNFQMNFLRSHFVLNLLQQRKSHCLARGISRRIGLRINCTHTLSTINSASCRFSFDKKQFPMPIFKSGGCWLKCCSKQTHIPARHGHSGSAWYLINLQSNQSRTSHVSCKQFHLHANNYISKKLPTFSKVIDGTVDNTSKYFQKNSSKYSELQEKFQKVLSVAMGGGSEKAKERHTQINKKILVTDRLRLLLDDYDEMLELSTLAGLGMEYGDIPRAGNIVGIGKIQGVNCLIAANDATVKAGTMYPITVKKQLRAQQIAIENHIPVIYLVDSGGAFLPLQGDIFIEGGRAFYNEAIMNSLDIPGVAIVVGSCTAGAAYVPTMAQEAVIVDKIGTIFLGGPPLVYAALGEKVSAENLGGGRLHSSVSGYTDYFALNEPEAFQIGRDIVAAFNIHAPDAPVDVEDPLFDVEELPGIIPCVDQHKMNIYQVLARLLDGSKFHEFKAAYGTSLVSGFAHVQGYLVGIVANNGEMTGDAASKGAHFVQLCSQRNIPIIFLQNTVPDMAPVKKESIGNRIRSHARLMASVATSHVPKITVILGNSFGSTNFMMAGRSFGPRFMFSWPNAKIGMMQPQALANKIVQSQFTKDTDIAPAVRRQMVSAVEDQMADQCSALYASSHLWDDGVIAPQQTRQVLGKCLEIIHQTPWKRPSESDSPPVIRM